MIFLSLACRVLCPFRITQALVSLLRSNLAQLCNAPAALRLRRRLEGPGLCCKLLVGSLVPFYMCAPSLQTFKLIAGSQGVPAWPPLPSPGPVLVRNPEQRTGRYARAPGHLLFRTCEFHQPLAACCCQHSTLTVHLKIYIIRPDRHCARPSSSPLSSCSHRASCPTPGSLQSRDTVADTKGRKAEIQPFPPCRQEFSSEPAASFPGLKKRSQWLAQQEGSDTVKYSTPHHATKLRSASVRS